MKRLFAVVVVTVFAACSNSDGGSDVIAGDDDIPATDDGPMPSDDDVDDGGGDDGDNEGEPTTKGDGSDCVDPGDGSIPPRLRYPTNASHSPLTSAITSRLFAIAAKSSGRNAHRFMKIGDAMSDAPANMTCFASAQPANDIILGSRTDLQASIDWFNAGNVDSPSTCSDASAWFTTTPNPLACSDRHNGFNRNSAAASDDATAQDLLVGDPTQLATEDAVTQPLFAIVQYGSNDTAGILSSGATGTFLDFYTNLTTDIDALIDRGIIPIVEAIPPKANVGEGAASRFNVPSANALIRIAAQSRAVPFIDLWREMVTIPADGETGVPYGLGPDGVQPRVSVDTTRATSLPGCHFNSVGLAGGTNVRNLAQMVALDRVHRVMACEAPPDASAGTDPGSGPYVVDTLPYTDSVAASPADMPVYTVTINTAGAYRVMVFDPNEGTPLAYLMSLDGNPPAPFGGVTNAWVPAGQLYIFLGVLEAAPYAIAVVQLDPEDPTD